MTISVGDKMPSGKVRVITADGPNDVDATSLFDGRTVAVVGLPGAFTPTCNDNHVPGYLENVDALKAKGVEAIYVLSVNDHYVMSSWEKALHATGKLHMIADWDASYATALGLNIDLGVAGLGMRAKRFSIVVKNGVATVVEVEDSPGEVSNTSAATMLNAL